MTQDTAAGSSPRTPRTTAAAAQRRDPQAQRLADLRALPARGHVRARHQASGQRGVDGHDPVSLGQLQPEVPLHRVEVVGVVAAGVEGGLAPERGTRVRDRVEAHEHRPHVPGGERGARSEGALTLVHLAHAATHHGGAGIRVEHLELALEPRGLGPVVRVLDGHHGGAGLAQPVVEARGYAAVREAEVGEPGRRPGRPPRPGSRRWSRRPPRSARAPAASGRGSSGRRAPACRRCSSSR